MNRDLKRVVLFAALVLALAWSSAAAQSEISNPVYLPLISRPDTNPIRQGDGTYYDATGAGACGFDASPNDLMVAAMNQADYNGSQVCGEYVTVSGPLGAVTVRIVDLCPGCASGDLDLSAQAFAKIANLPQGRVPITWQVISPHLAGPIAYHIKDGSNQWWTAVQIRNHRNPVASLAYLKNGAWVNVPRLSYNYFVEASGMGPGPYTFRVSDVYGNVLSDSGIALVANSTVNGAAQFPVGP